MALVPYSHIARISITLIDGKLVVKWRGTRDDDLVPWFNLRAKRNAFLLSSHVPFS